MSLPQTQCTKFAEKEKSFLNLSGTRWLGFRDLPFLIKQFVFGKTALDYGCGIGTSTLFLKSYGFNVDGVDISKDMIYEARKGDPEGAYSVIKSGQVPICDNYYDLTISQFVFPFISSTAEIRKVLKEIRRCLKPEGILICTVTNENTHKYNWLSINTDFQENKNVYSGSLTKMKFTNGVPIYLHYWDEHDYRQAISDSGLNVVGVEYPLGYDTDGYRWITEKHIPPYTIYVAKKT